MTQLVSPNRFGNACQTFRSRKSRDQTPDYFQKADAGAREEEGTATIKGTGLKSAHQRNLERHREHGRSEPREEPQQTAAGVLTKLADRSLSRELLRKFILEAEVVSFDADQSNTLKPLLRQYIEQHRDSTDSADLIAVASAIRKYVGILDREEVSSVGFVLEAGHKAPVPPEIELEVTKMVVRKLSAVLPLEATRLTELGSQLMDLARTYLNPRLLPRPYHGAIALNSVLALALLPETHLPELLTILQRLQLSWFNQLVIRRAEAIKQDLTRRVPDNESRPQRDRLDSLVRAIQVGS